jgi:hypothetical protein
MADKFSPEELRAAGELGVDPAKLNFAQVMITGALGCIANAHSAGVPIPEYIVRSIDEVALVNLLDSLAGIGELPALVASGSRLVAELRTLS